MKQLNTIYIDNFKIFDKPVEFSFNDLNIFTGANNSGKSTLFKAIKLFSHGIKNTDFPKINLISNALNIGHKNDLLNRGSKNERFCLGFNVSIKGIEDTFQAVYTFTLKSSGNNKGEPDEAIFTILELYNSRKELFIKMISTEGNIEESDFDGGIQKPHEASEPIGLVELRLNLLLIKTYLPALTKHAGDYTDLLVHLDSIASKDKFWCSELFDEEVYDRVEYDLSLYTFNDLLMELHNDFFVNIGDYETRNGIIMMDSDDRRADYKKYCRDLKYHDFLQNILQPILTGISSALDLFRSNNLVHIAPALITDRLIPATPENEYLISVSKSSESLVSRKNRALSLLEFVYQSLKIFGIDGLPEIIYHLNSHIEINLIAGVDAVITELKNKPPDGLTKELIEQGLYQYLNQDLDFQLPGHRIHLDSFSENQRIHIHDLGKGTTQILMMILKVAATAFSQESKISKMKVEENTSTEMPGNIPQATILIEEPEAYLHPNWQSKLADFLLYCILNLDARFIVETHSVYLIQKLQYLTATRAADPKRIRLFYFNPEGAEDKYYTLRLREDGIINENFGEGFYDEIARLTASILNAQKLN